MLLDILDHETLRCLRGTSTNRQWVLRLYLLENIHLPRMFYLSCPMNFTFPTSLHLNFTWQWVARCLQPSQHGLLRLHKMPVGSFATFGRGKHSSQGSHWAKEGDSPWHIPGKNRLNCVLSSFLSLWLNHHPVGAVRCRGVSWIVLPLVREASLVLISLMGVNAVCSTTGWRGCECGYWELWFMNRCS